MAQSNEQTELESIEEVDFKMRRSFSWDRAFFTSDGFLDAEELSSMIEGGGDDVRHQLQKIEEIECLEAKLFQEMEASNQKSTGTSNVTGSSINLSPGKKDSQAKMRAASAAPSSSSTPVKTVPPARSPPSSGGSGGSLGKKVKSPARTTSSKTGKATADSPSKASAGITTRNKVVPVGTCTLRTSPASPGSSGSSSSTLSVNQRSKRSSSVPRRSSLNSEKPSAINSRRNDKWKTTKNKVTPVNTRISRTPPASPVSSGSSTFSVNQWSKRSSSVPRRSSSNSAKPSASNARRNDEWITVKNKVPPVNSRISRTQPASPVSSGLSSTFSVNQRSKRSSSVPRRSSVISEKPSAQNDEWKTCKPAVRLIPKTQSSICLKIKPPPVVSHPSSPSGLSSSSSSSTAQPPSESSSSPSTTCTVDQRSKSMRNKGHADPQRYKSSLKNHPTGQTTDRNGKQPAASRPGTRSPNTRKLLAPKTVAAVNTGLKPVSQKTTTPKPFRTQSSAKAKSSTSSSRGAENIILVSPEVMDIKGKLNALKMEISMQKKERCKETKISLDESGKGESSSIIQMNNQTKSI